MPTKIICYKRLGIATDDDTIDSVTSKIKDIPQITALIPKLMTKLAEKKLSTDPYFYLNVSDNGDARKLMRIYNSIPRTFKEHLPIESFCLAAGVDPLNILQAIVDSISRLNAMNAAVNLSVAQPEVVDTTVNAALDIDNGHKDRRLYMQVSGLMPTSKGAQTIVNVRTSANASSAPVQVVAAPPPEQTVRRLSERLHAVRGTLPAPIDAEVVEE